MNEDLQPAPLPLPVSLDAPAIARQYVQAVCARLSSDELDDALVVASEVVTNAVIHGAAEIVMTVNLAAGRVTVAVSDEGSGRPPLHPTAPARSSLHGRGLLVVDEVASRWGVTEHGVGKDVWFQIATRDRDGELSSVAG
jgi:anti-sigma regulatory factor (Ser/Thr protein kinase)